MWAWTPYTRYYDRQADAFLAGSLSLLEKPPAELLALANPYDYHNREGLGYLWDASLYRGKYYLYWGPVPALVAAGVKLNPPGRSRRSAPADVLYSRAGNRPGGAPTLVAVNLLPKNASMDRAAVGNDRWGKRAGVVVNQPP
jgi:hypothetical protein